MYAVELFSFSNTLDWIPSQATSNPKKPFRLIFFIIRISIALCISNPLSYSFASSFSFPALLFLPSFLT